MSLDGTYSGLLSSVAGFIDRTDLTSQIPDFVKLFEADANQDEAIRTIFNKTSTTINTVIGQNYISLPSDFLTTESLINTVATGSNYEVLKPYATAASLYTDYPNAAAAQNRPKGFLALNGKFELAPVPDAVYPLQLYYYQKISALSTTNTTNWLLTNFPQLYLFGSLIAAEAYLGEDPRLITWGNLYNNSLQKIAGSTQRGLYGGSALSAKIDVVA